ncbi:MAG: alpha-amylase [Kofleriaceae bacterium]|jgi:alpha-amylase|nr:alpha-amylase [Kofleriaceae bacterium]MBP9169934.1 alpha-amylase [Kofleriaceae bacterium]MBP9858362.1 alpha-amylase [Kofleriaceae bacterium]
MKLPALLSLAALAACGASDLTHPTDLPHRPNTDVDWRDQVIYQIMVDRFANGDPNNDHNVAPSVPARYHGGDWQGVIDQLDYLEELGVTALWISPVVGNTEEDAGFASYHGYWTQDFLRPNPHFGDLYKLREMVDAAHARGMLVILDVVTNHVGQLFFYDINGNGQPDDWISGGGLSHTCVQICSNPSTASQCSPDELVYCDKGKDYLERIIEWDPEYDPRGVQGWTSLGFSGPATVRFTDWPEQNRVPPPRPPSWFGWPSDKPWFDDPSWYNRKGRVYVWWHERDYSRDFVREQETTGDFPGGLKDLDTDNPDVADALARVFEYWIEAADFDGFRIDTIKHIDRPEIAPNRRGFWGVFADRMRAKAASLGKSNFFLFGEAFDGNDELIGAYTHGGVDGDGRFGRFDSVFYFSQKYRVIDAVFKQGQPTANIECMYNSRIGRNPGDSWCQGQGYPAGPTFGPEAHAPSAAGGIGLAPQQVPVNFLDNHDLPRFLFDATAEQLRISLAYLFTWDGIPCVYYGTEQAFAGGVDPANREDLWRGNPALGYPAYDTQNPAFAQVRDWIALRKARAALRRGDVQIKWSVRAAGARRDAGIFAFERATADDKVVVVLNASTQTSESCAPAADGGSCMVTSFAPGTVLRDLAPGSDGATFTVGAGGSLAVTVPGQQARVLAP